MMLFWPVMTARLFQIYILPQPEIQAKRSWFCQVLSWS
jgi:hypothetical protein